MILEAVNQIVSSFLRNDLPFVHEALEQHILGTEAACNRRGARVAMGLISP